MKPGLRMMMMQPKPDERMDYADPNRRRIGFGANEERRHEPRREEIDEPHRMMGGDYPMPDDPEMRRRRRDERGRYMTYEPEMTYPGNITPIRRTWPQRAHEERETKREHEPVRAGGTFWMIPPGGEHEPKLTREKAEEWVRKMSHNGQMWTFEDAKRIGEECGVKDDKQSQIDFYAALNMVASDYGKVARKYGIDDERFYADLAMAFLHDEDGKRPTEKLAAYYKAVVPHDED